MAGKANLGLPLSAALILAGCVGAGERAPDPQASGASAADTSACLTAVAEQTGNSVSVLRSEVSEANTLVMVGVGPQQAPWRCLVSGGQVADVMSMTDEGAL